MRTREGLRALVGGLVVYAACSSGAGLGVGVVPNETADGGSEGHGGTGGELGTVVDPKNDAAAELVDALTNPVPDAEAAIAPPTTATEKCVTTPGDSGVRYFYATHSFPGKTISDLSALRVIAHIGQASVAPPGYENVAIGTIYVNDGEAAVQCASASGATIYPNFDTVTFILP